jgi:hypothetical protein
MAWEFSYYFNGLFRNNKNLTCLQLFSQIFKLGNLFIYKEFYLVPNLCVLFPGRGIPFSEIASSDIPNIELNSKSNGEKFEETHINIHARQ